MALTRTPPDDDKRSRLAAALRENLKRRKAQGRAREHAFDADEAMSPEPDLQPQADAKRS